MKATNRKRFIKMLLPKEIQRLEPSKMTKDDMLIAIGWNMYRQELINTLKI